MKLKIEDWIEEVKENLFCYEGGEKIAQRWEGEFRAWLKQSKNLKKKYIKEEKGKIYFIIQDEEEVMETADSYFDALEENAVKKYWNEF